MINHFFRSASSLTKGIFKSEWMNLLNTNYVVTEIKRRTFDWNL